MPLTRFLFMSDEVILTFLENLLKRTNLRECYYWISEFYYSGRRTKTWQLLFQIFYDFYAIKYPKLEEFIINEYKKWVSKKCIRNVMKIVLQLFERIPCCEVFLARHTEKVYKRKAGRPPKWLASFPPGDKDMLLCIHKKDIPGILYYMEKFNPNDAYMLVCQYFQIVHKMHLQKSKLDIIPLINKKNIILALILHLHRSCIDIVLNNSISMLHDADVNWIQEINNLPIEPVYYTLPRKRFYNISTTIGAFNLSRFNPLCPPMKKLLGFHWEYFASFSPLWRKRFRQYHAKQDIKAYSMVFATDSDLEAFGEKYNYEPDEQSNETQNRSIINIEKSSGGKWIEDIFGVKCCRVTPFPAYFAALKKN